jgi:hypothetical protein
MEEKIFDEKKVIKIKKSMLKVYALIVVVTLIVMVFYFSYSPSMNILSIKQPVETLEERFARLNFEKSNVCAGPQALDNTNNLRLQGACCGKMDFHRYKEQLEGLKDFSKIKQIPKDPYDIPRELADELLEYQKNIQLSSEQQEIYDEAVEMSHEGGPCCCKCWRWYAFEGLAKYLITEENFGAEQIAEIWDLEDGCGGPGHVEGVSGH